MTNKPEYVILHHSLTFDGKTVDWTAIRKYHKEVLGFDDVGYHYGIEFVGENALIQVGRPEGMEGAHTRELHMNRRSIGICVTGNYDLAPPKLPILCLLSSLVRRICTDYTIPADRIIGHRDVGMMAGFDWRTKGSTGVRRYKTCPGVYFPLQTVRDMAFGTITEVHG